MTWLTGDLLANLTAPALLLVIVLLVMLGFVVPRSVLLQVRQDRDARLADAQQQIVDWREAHRLSETAREKQAEALRESLEVARAAEDALKGFRAATSWVESERERGGTG